MGSFFDYIGNASFDMFNILKIFSNLASFISIKNCLSIECGFSDYADYLQKRKNGYEFDWSIMLSNEYQTKIKASLYRIDGTIPENILSIVIMLMDNGIMRSAPITFRPLDVISHDFIIDDDNDSWKNKRKMLTNEVMIPLITNVGPDVMHSISELYYFMNLDFFYKKLLNYDKSGRLIKSKVMRPINQRYDVVNHCFTAEDVYMQWTFLIMPFLSTRAIFDFVLENKTLIA